MRTKAAAVATRKKLASGTGKESENWVTRETVKMLTMTMKSHRKVGLERFTLQIDWNQQEVDGSTQVLMS